MKLKFGNYIIRSWSHEDISALLKYADNRNIWINLRDLFPHPYTLDHAKAFIAKALAKEPETFFAIASDKEAIGGIGLNLGEDVHRYTAELGYWLAEPYWNQGIMTEAVCAFTDYAFEKFGLVRIYAEPYSSNTASARVLEKSDFQHEGVLKCSVYKNGKVLDQIMYAKIRNWKLGIGN